MINLRRNNERRHLRHGEQDLWLTFYPQEPSTQFDHGFGVLTVLNEIRLPPEGSSEPTTGGNESEILAYVEEGSLTYRDSAGVSDLVSSGEFVSMVIGLGVRSKETNPSILDFAHTYRISLRASQAGGEPSRERKRFTVAQRREGFRVVASPDGRKCSLLLSQDALIFSAIIDRGRHLIYELKPRRSAWLHIVRGEVLIGDSILTAGDGAGVSSERAISVTAREDSEILLLDLPEDNQRFGELREGE